MVEGLVSIIMPVYNTEQFVSKAIESVLHQTYKNFELIIVNDGSSDKSGNICEKFAKKDQRITLIHQKNCGVAKARNVGIENAKGEYIQFLDSDDVMDDNKTAELIHLFNNELIDIVFCGFELTGRINHTIRSTQQIYNKNDFLLYSYGDINLKSIISSVCMCMFKSILIKNKNISFNNRFIVGEDGLFLLSYLSFCKKIYVTDKVLYNCNKYEFNERISITSHTTKDIYIFYICHFKKLLKAIDKDLSKSQLTDIARHFFDRLIPSLIILKIYTDLSLQSILLILNKIVQDKQIHQLSKSYKRINKKHSILIPLFIKWKLVLPLYYILCFRSRKYIKINGKSELVNSVYFDN